MTDFLNTAKTAGDSVSSFASSAVHNAEDAVAKIASEVHVIPSPLQNLQPSNAPIAPVAQPQVVNNALSNDDQGTDSQTVQAQDVVAQVATPSNDFLQNAEDTVKNGFDGAEKTVSDIAHQAEDTLKHGIESVTGFFGNLFGGKKPEGKAKQ